MFVSGDQVVSGALREREMRRDVEGGEAPASPIVGYDDDGVAIEGELIPWREPRPPDAPPPRRSIGGHSIAKPNRERRAYTEQLYVAQYSSTEISEIITARFGCSSRTVTKDLAIIKARYLERASEPQIVEQRREQMLGTMRLMLHESRAAGDRQTARFLVDKMCKVGGLYAPIKIESSHTSTTLGISIEVVANALDEEGLKALELVLAQVEKAGIKLPSYAQQAIAPGAKVLDAESTDVDDDEGDDDDE